MSDTNKMNMRERYEANRTQTGEPLQRQEGGSHYRDMTIQPIEFIHANGIQFCEANVIKYVCRHRSKNGKADLLKAKHYIELLIQLEYSEPDCEAEKA